MAFQSTVFLQQGFGVPGDLYTNSPLRSESYILHSSDPTINIVGRACTITGEGIVTVGGTGVFAGILADPKILALRGTTAGPLVPTLLVSQDSQVDVVSMGTMVIILPAPAALGDLVVFDTTTGVLSTIVPGAPLATGTGFAYAAVDYRTVTAAGPAVITLTPTLTIPVPAGL